jgi:4-hydroxythreonine-4-phosphate dehydrogenase
VCRPRPRARIVLIGDSGATRETADVLGLRERIEEVSFADIDGARAGTSACLLLSPGTTRQLPALAKRDRRPGRPSLAGACAAYESIRTAAELLRRGTADALCTAPINKEWFARAGVARTGHTEILGALSGVPKVRLMMVLDRLRVALVTSHLALRDVPAALSVTNVLDTIRMTAQHLERWWKIRGPRIAVAALNPHASDGGIYGDEEARIVSPAIRKAQAAGIEAIGPVPADTLFSALGPACDAIVALYHDQGLIPIKQRDVHRTVNVTLGLPFVRTSPDHGTAYDLAGKSRADPSSMRAAIDLALELAVRGQKEKSRPARQSRLPTPRGGRAS